jgi:hypothetical protein
VRSNRRTTRAWAAAVLPCLPAALLALGLGACSGGTYPSGYYTSGQPFGDAGDEAGSEEDTGIDLDGGGPPPPPGDDGGLPPAPGHGDCCAGHDSAGCDNKPVEQCVCASDSWCCESEWDDACTALIEQLGCGHCTAGDGGDPPTPEDTTGGDPPPPPSDDGGGDPPPPSDDGGGDPPPPSGDGGGDPPPPSGDGGGDPPPDEPPAEGGDCCTGGEAPGCGDATIQACVCMQDSYCCDTAWDGVCVDEVGSFGCGSCGGGAGDGGGGGDGGTGVSTCCEQQDGAGCPDTTVQDCVCAQDDYCCNVAWDLTCAGEVETLSCGSCG